MTNDIMIMTKTEMNIMEMMWEPNQAKTIVELAIDILNHHGKQMKSSTINTLCARLMKKGFITYIQVGGRNLYLPLISKAEYQFLVAKLLAVKLFNGSTTELVSSLLTDYDLSQEMLCQLKEMVESAMILLDTYKPKQEKTETETENKPKARQPKRLSNTVAVTLNKSIRNIRREYVKKKDQKIIHLPRGA